MGKIWVEVCILSARGLRRKSSFFKLQWFAVGWIDPNNKYCTKIDSSGNANPIWKTKFIDVVDESSNFQDLALNIEVYSREPIFLREKLQGSATIGLKEFLIKYNGQNVEGSKPGNEEVGSYQLRKRNSNKPQGFVDVSIRVSEEREEPSSYPGDDEGGIVLTDNNNGIRLSNEGSLGKTYHPTHHPLATAPRPENQSKSNFLNPNSTPYPRHNSNLYFGGTSYPPPMQPTYHPPPPRTPPPPPPPSNVGYMPTLIPRTENLSTTCINMPSSAGPHQRGPRPGFAVGAGAGALAAGAIIFGDDFMSGFDLSPGLQDANITISTDPPF